LSKSTAASSCFASRDTDKARSTEESTRAIFEGLEWLGLQWDEDVVHQGANVARHQADVARLLDAGKAFRCFCTQAELDEQRAAAAAKNEAFHYDRRCDRLAADEGRSSRGRMASLSSFAFACPRERRRGPTSFTGGSRFPNKDIGEGDFIVLRSDGTPIYNLAVVSDDIAMGHHRGDARRRPRFQILQSRFFYMRPWVRRFRSFAHLPMIHGNGREEAEQAPRCHCRRRLSAPWHPPWRHAQLPRASLGWSPGNDIEVMSVPQMIELFSVDRLSKKSRDLRH